MIILGIETSCDETAASIVRADNGCFQVVSNVVASQVKTHAKYGGVVPEVAARLHIQKILPIIESALENAKVKIENVDCIAVCAGPGLMSSLLIGVETAKTLAMVLHKPLIRTNHIEGHLYSVFAGKNDAEQKIRFPAIALVVSGGHSQIILMKDFLKYKLIGETRDDAAGEAFDKAAKIMDLGYPGGPAISNEADKLDGRTSEFNIKLPRPMLNSDNFNFSFSGLKTAVLYKWRDLKLSLNKKQLERARRELAVEFQNAVVECLVSKTMRAAQANKAKTIVLGGGVSANKALRESLESAVAEELPRAKLLTPLMEMTGDNAAMIAIAGYFHAKGKDFIVPEELTADPNWELVE
ncbi:tRNA (adenosine(37)-N6)-threonylcarbamoyltransferase complex transferase subunit TsaD [Patescibacteria group bacterium]|nr:tRNA (adenosine(37)-N6)-threonylcarbamoyltransferase complex transferase subunit TsaD [Patescibacteria group bacterium]